MEPTPYLRSEAAQTLADASTRAFMNRVYSWMFAGLAVTGVTAFVASSSTEILNALFGFRFVLMIGIFAFGLFVSAAIPRMAPQAAGALFLTYAVALGLWLSPLFVIYHLGSVARVFFITAGTFGGLSVYGAVTKKDLTSWGTFLFMGFWGVLAICVVNVFWPSPMLSFVAGCMGVIVFAGLTAYDTQKLRAYGAMAEASGQRSMAINGALNLYLDFINLFLSLLRLLGSRR